MAGWTVVPNLDPTSAWTPVAASTPAEPITANPNGEGTYKMNGNGQTVQVPFSKVALAQTQGLQLHNDDVDRYGKDAGHGHIQRMIDNFNAGTQGANPGDNAAMAALNNFGAGGGDAVRGALNAVKHPINTVKSIVHSITPQIAADGSTTIPLATDLGNSLVHQPMRTLGNVGTGAIIGAPAGALAGKVLDSLSPEAAITGENFTPSQLKAHTGLIARSTGLGDNFIPQQASADTLSAIRQAAADNPAIAQAAKLKGSTPANIAAFQNILQKANTALEAPHAATIAKYAGAPADVSSIQNAVKSSLPSTLTGVDPEAASALSDLSDRIGTVNTMGGLNDLRQWLNKEASSSFKQDGIAANRGAATQQAYKNAANAARGSYFDQLQGHSGIDFQPIKQQQSALMSQQEGIAGLGQKLAAQQGLADEPKNIPQVISDALTGGRAIKAGPIAGTAQLAAEKVLGRTPLTQPNYLIRKALSNLPNASPTSLVNDSVPASTLTNGPALPPPSPSQLSGGDQIMNLPPLSVSRLLSDASSARSMPIQTAYPNLNEATASTRIQPTQFSNPEIIPPNVTRPVGPDGQVGVPFQRFLDSGPLGKAIQNPSTNDLLRAIENMRKRKAS